MHKSQTVGLVAGLDVAPFPGSDPRNVKAAPLDANGDAAGAEEVAGSDPRNVKAAPLDANGDAAGVEEVAAPNPKVALLDADANRGLLVFSGSEEFVRTTVPAAHGAGSELGAVTGATGLLGDISP